MQAIQRYQSSDSRYVASDVSRHFRLHLPDRSQCKYASECKNFRSPTEKIGVANRLSDDANHSQIPVETAIEINKS